MKTHHFYYLSAFLVIGGFFALVYLFVSEVIWDEQSIKTEQASSMVRDTTAVVATVSNTTSVNQVKGIDISKYQGDISWNELTSKITFIICKATEGRTLIDTEFRDNWASIAKYGRIRGAYHFYISTDDPVTQAEFFWSTIPDYGPRDLPLVLDIESASLRGAVDKETLEKDLLQFLTKLESLSGKTPIVYSNTDFAKNYLNTSAFSKYPLWIAEYTKAAAPRIPKAWAETGWTFWQRSASYDLNAVNGDVDFDVFDGDADKLSDFIEYAARMAQ